MKYSVGILTAAVFLTGCATAPPTRPPPPKPAEVREAVLWQNGVEQCIQNGWGNVPALVAFRENIESFLSMAPQNVINAQIKSIKKSGGIPKVKRSDCRSAVAAGYSIQKSNRREEARSRQLREEKRRQSESFSRSMDRFSRDASDAMHRAQDRTDRLLADM